MDAFEDETFADELRANLPEGLYADHRDHVDRMLASSPDVEPWAQETSLLRAGMRLSSDPSFRRPSGAAGLIRALVETLTRLMNQDADLEEWFFAVLSGVATNPDAVAAFARYDELMGPKDEPFGTAHARAPEGSGADRSEVEAESEPDFLDEDERDSQLVYGSDDEAHLRMA